MLPCGLYKEFSLNLVLSRKMASASKRSRTCRVDLTPLDEALERIFNEEDSSDGMESGEESDLDRQLENETGESR